jgi:deoxyribodipyrimidine photolyase-related protein
MKSTDKKYFKTLRLILGDQLNANHTWFQVVDDSVCFIMMEIRTETDYASHHLQKVVGFFTAMRNFAEELKSKGHSVIYLQINDENNKQSFEENCLSNITKLEVKKFEYLFPDEYRLDQILKKFCDNLIVEHEVFDTEHFFTVRNELATFFEGKKTYLMESFYRQMRKKHQILVEDNQPLNGKRKIDDENRKKIPKNHVVTRPLVFDNNVEGILKEIQATDIKTIGNIDAKNFIWPINRTQSLKLLDFFVDECLPFFGTFEDAMAINEWSVYHSRLSFSMNLKLISPKEVIEKAISAWEKQTNEITFNQLEGFVRQIIGWREYMRGIYWLKMPEFSQLNYFNNKSKLPEWFWTGKTKMECLKQTISQSLDFAYAHHIQRLMITGNFALLTGTDPSEVDKWYLGIYIDALDWVEITNTRGMSQFADGGIIGSKPYVSSATYIDKMSNYCSSCKYDKKIKVGEKACPFNSLYWNFYDRNEEKLSKNPRIGMVYHTLNKMDVETKNDLLNQAAYYLEHINEL